MDERMIKFSMDGCMYFEAELASYEVIMQFIKDHAVEITSEEFLDRK